MRSATDQADIDTLKTVIRSILKALDGEDIISPHEAATMAMKKIDERIRYIAAHLEIRQLVRGMLRGTYDEDDRQPPLPNLPLVQERYPTLDGRGYITREKMSKKDAKGNVSRLRGKGRKLIAHGDQLELWAKDWFPDYDDAGKEDTGTD